MYKKDNEKMSKKIYDEVNPYTGQLIKYDEDAPANATGAAVAGTGDDSSVVVVRRKKDKEKKMFLDARTKAYKQHAEKLQKMRERRSKLKEKILTQTDEFYREMFSDIFSYVSHRIPEISDETYRIDQAMKAGFGWELGPFEIWDAIAAQAAYDKAI